MRFYLILAERVLRCGDLSEKATTANKNKVDQYNFVSLSPLSLHFNKYFPWIGETLQLSVAIDFSLIIGKKLEWKCHKAKHWESRTDNEWAMRKLRDERTSQWNEIEPEEIALNEKFKLLKSIHVKLSEVEFANDRPNEWEYSGEKIKNFHFMFPVQKIIGSNSHPFTLIRLTQIEYW